MFKYNNEISFGENTSHGELLKLISRGETILEFGCAKGELAGYIKENLDGKIYGIEISRTALDEAMPCLERGICCDVENYDWENELKDVKFDTLIFADVLEHLRDPAKVIRRALPLLKDDGKIVFSVPNIANSDIVLKLLNNRFDYTSIGLLDNTHVHFFAKENLVDFFAEAGTFPTYITGTSASVNSTEQAIDNMSPLLESAVRSNEYAEVYQFVGVAYKSSYAKKKGYKTEWNLKKIYVPMTVFCFLSSNDEEIERRQIPVNHDGEDSFFNLSIPRGATKIKVTPFSERNLYATKVKMLIDGSETAPINARAFSINEGFFSVQNELPYFVYKIKATARNLVFETCVLPVVSDETISLTNSLVTSIDNSSKKLSSLNSKFEQSLASLDKANAEIARITEQAQAEKERLDKEIARLLEQAEIEKEKAEKKLHRALEQAKRERARADSDISLLREKVEKHRADHINAVLVCNDLRARLEIEQFKYNTVSGAFFWKITKPFRLLLDIIKWPFLNLKPFKLIGKFFKSWAKIGLKPTLRKMSNRKMQRRASKRFANLTLDEAELEKQKDTVFPRDVKFSILVPLYNTPEDFLCEMIDSVVNQTYSNWELCLADGSTDEFSSVGHICKKYASADKRIVYKKLAKNLGISENTNACIDMATGDFIALFDHDDVLHPSALYHMMHAICYEGADYVYTDEATFESPNLKKLITIHCKPDFALDNLRGNNYICHFSAFSREVLDKAGRFRSEFDGSQDHDLILRLTENAKKIVHIPMVLYWWRSHPASVAGDINSKTYAFEAGRKAVLESVKRAGLDAVVESSKVFPTIYRIKYKLKDTPKVSIIIPNKDRLVELEDCVDSIVKFSTYKNYEIIIVDGGSLSGEVSDYYNELERDGIAKICYAESDTFNYSELVNIASEQATGEHYIFLHNDIRIITPEWIEEMLMYAQRDDVGIVGSMLYYPNNTIQHAGMIMRMGDPGSIAGRPFHQCNRGEIGYMGRLWYSQNVSAVSAGCMLVKASLFKKLGGFDERLAMAYHDIDFCARARELGQLIVWTPYAEAYHQELKTRRTPSEKTQIEKEEEYFKEKWEELLEQDDPYFNPNFDLSSVYFCIKP